MSENTKDPLAHLPRRSLFADGTTARSGEPIKTYKLGDETIGVYGTGNIVGPEGRALTKPEQAAMHQALRNSMKIVHKASRGRPKREDGYPGPSCGLSRAQWYRQSKADKENNPK